MSEPMRSAEEWVGGLDRRIDYTDITCVVNDHGEALEEWVRAIQSDARRAMAEEAAGVCDKTAAEYDPTDEYDMRDEVVWGWGPFARSLGKEIRALAGEDIK